MRTVLATAALALLAAPAWAWAQDTTMPDMPGMAGMAPAAQDASDPAPDPHAGHGSDHGHRHRHKSATPSRSAAPDPHAGHAMPMQHATPMDPAMTMDHAMPMDPAMPMPASGEALPRTPIPALTEADRAAAFPVLHSHAMHDMPGINRYLLLDRLEGWDRDRGSGQAWEASAWIGGDIDRLWLRSEGERAAGRTGSADLEALYGHAISPWWDLLLGARQQFGDGHRGWAAFGVQGLAPYKFEFAATGYLAGAGNALLKLEGEYDILLSNRLILQPKLEARFALDGDAARRDGDALQAGLRLRYEVNRQFAPYLGIEHERRFGDGLRQARRDGDALRNTRWVLGLRLWF